MHENVESRGDATPAIGRAARDSIVGPARRVEASFSSRRPVRSAIRHRMSDPRETLLTGYRLWRLKPREIDLDQI